MVKCITSHPVYIVLFPLHLTTLVCTFYDISPRENKAMSYILYVFININVVLSVQDIRKLTKEKLSETRVPGV